jgi:hypothetical protein
MIKTVLNQGTQATELPDLAADEQRPERSYPFLGTYLPKHTVRYPRKQKP